MPASLTNLDCRNPSEAALLAAALSRATWTSRKPDLVFANNATVELSWNTVAVPRPDDEITSAIKTVRAAGTTELGLGLGLVTMRHSASGKTTTTRI